MSSTAKASKTPGSYQRKWRARYSRQLTGLLFVLPCVLFVGVFFVLPLFMTVWMSLHDWPLLGGKAFIGLDNYRWLVQDGQFWQSLWFTTKVHPDRHAPYLLAGVRVRAYRA